MSAAKRKRPEDLAKLDGGIPLESRREAPYHPNRRAVFFQHNRLAFQLRGVNPHLI